jgi:hypothetical protein
MLLRPHDRAEASWDVSTAGRFTRTRRRPQDLHRVASAWAGQRGLVWFELQLSRARHNGVLALSGAGELANANDRAAQAELGPCPRADQRRSGPVRRAR